MTGMPIGLVNAIATRGQARRSIGLGGAPADAIHAAPVSASWSRRRATLTTAAPDGC
jgi:hypothetical protein